MASLHRISIWLCALALFYGGADAQRPMGTSICDYYTTALLKNNNAADQKLIMTLIVNTAIIGTYTKPSLVAVAGILAPGTYTDPTTGQNTTVNLAPYFNGALASTNRGGLSGVSVNFLDDGGAIPLTLNMAANGTNSNQYRLMTHLYEYFGALLGCSMLGQTDFPAYAGAVSQYDIHKFMDLTNAQLGYFITQVAYSAASLGVAAADLQIIGAALATTFGMRCAPAATVIAAQGAQLQSICTDPNTCPLAVNGVCPNTIISAPQTASAGPAGTTSSARTSTTAGTPAASTSGSSSSDSVSSGPNTLAIGLGVSLGVVLVLCLAGGIWFLIRRRRRRNDAVEPSSTQGKSELHGTSTVPVRMVELEGNNAPKYGSAFLGEMPESAGGRQELYSFPEGKAELDGRGMGS